MLHLFKRSIPLLSINLVVGEEQLETRRQELFLFVMILSMAMVEYRITIESW